MPEPEPPGDWVNDETCDCGAVYKKYKAFSSPGAAFDMGVEMVRAANPDSVYFSRGPVLWAAHVAKLDAWYWLHKGCSDAG